ncbi:g1228 [Coccomyxa viridis]|uniref:Prefoldin subunit 3 n=1 Tax=Coccomyxa viridis TaxID=1274662 RepID=A0ABP1FMT5_9CHLO
MTDADEAASSLPAAKEELIRVPKAEFISDVGAFLEGRTADAALQELEENYKKYKYIEQELRQSRVRLMTKVPEIAKALSAVELLIQKQEADEEVTLDFSLSEQVYAKAKVKDVTSVGLWLGADVMLDYPLEDAKQLLSTNLENAKRNLENNTRELEVLKDFTTITEVSIARVYNHDLMRKKGLQKQGQTA